MTFVSAPLHRVSQEFYESVRSKCTPLVVEPGTRIEDIMYAAGQQKVLEWIAQSVGTHSDKPNREV